MAYIVYFSLPLVSITLVLFKYYPSLNKGLSEDNFGGFESFTKLDIMANLKQPFIQITSLPYQMLFG